MPSGWCTALSASDNLNSQQFSPKWSGPPVGQLAFGVHDLSHGQPTSHGDFTPHDPFEVDQHGFLYERTGVPGTLSRVTPSADKAAGNAPARDLYKRYGGGKDTAPEVQSHWDNQPLHQVRSDTPVHTSQDFATTEYKKTENKAAGRERINGIRQSLQSGEDIKKPAWLVRQSGRLYAMDGHHRIVASREEGRETYPARVWDRDAEKKKR
jgi:hypothetical protein